MSNIMNSLFFSSNLTTFLSTTTIFCVHRTALAVLTDTHIITALIISTVVFVTINSLRQKNIQGLPCWPIIGMLPSLIMGIRVDVYEWISEFLCRVNGTFIFKGPWFSSVNFIVIWEPHNLEYLLKTKFSKFPKGNIFRENCRDLGGDGIFNADGDIWLRQRKTLSVELFHSSNFRSLTTNSLVELVHSRLLSYLEHSVQKSVSFDLQELLMRLTFDHVCMLTFGIDPHCLAANGLPSIPFAQALQGATEATALRFVMPTCVWKLMRYFNFGTEKWLRKSIMIVHEFVDQVIKQRKNELDASISHDSRQITETKSDLLTILMSLKDDSKQKNGQPYSDKFLRDICVNFILAGRDTSSVAMSWFFWLIWRHPGVEEKILEEIMKIVADRQNIPNAKEAIFSLEEVKKMEYLHAALTESLRLYPSVPLDIKEAIGDEVFPDGTAVKKGEKVLYSIYSMGRMKDIWGEDCLEYKPERWLKDGRFVSESAYKLSAFNGGPRLCLGKDFAYFQMKFVAASILYRFGLKVVEKHIVVPRIGLTLYMKHGLKVNLFKRVTTEHDTLSSHA